MANRALNGMTLFASAQLKSGDGSLIIFGYSPMHGQYIWAHCNNLTDTEWYWGNYYSNVTVCYGEFTDYLSEYCAADTFTEHVDGEILDALLLVSGPCTLEYVTKCDAVRAYVDGAFNASFPLL